MDALLSFGEPAPQTGSPDAAAAQQYRSRRELRDAEGRSARPIIQPVKQTVVQNVVQPVVQQAPRPVQPVARPVARPVAKASAARRRSRKNPFSVLATMAVVGGLFAVAGLPAYALQTTEYAASTVQTEANAQSVVVSADAAVTTAVRDEYHATTPEQLAEMESNALREANQAAYLASGARELGDDYPWPYELRDFQGGGLSPLNYYYRECVDFVAWRLNRDQGYYSAPFKWTWSTLTPNGGNGGQWMYNWQSKGWPVSKTPIVGAVAYTGGNHVAYVKSVNADGTVTIEEYNWVPGKYSQRTIPASSVVAFLYPPT